MRGSWVCGRFISGMDDYQRDGRLPAGWGKRRNERGQAPAAPEGDLSRDRRESDRSESALRSQTRPWAICRGIGARTPAPAGSTAARSGPLGALGDLPRDRRKNARDPLAPWRPGRDRSGVWAICRGIGAGTPAPGSIPALCEHVFDDVRGAPLPFGVLVPGRCVAARRAGSECAGAGYGALALTDHNSVSGSMEFAVAARALGLRAIHGAELDLDDGRHLTLLVRGRAGAGRTCAGSSRARTRTRARRPARRHAAVGGAARRA